MSWIELFCFHQKRIYCIFLTERDFNQLLHILYIQTIFLKKKKIFFSGSFSSAKYHLKPII